MSRMRPDFHATIEEKEVILDGGGSFSIKLSSGRERGDSFLVIDIYNLDNAVHPEGHVGWWRFEIDKLPEKLDGQLVRRKDGEISLKISGAAPVDEWRNPRQLDTSRLELLVVTRATITNSILSIDRVPVLRSSSDLQLFRSRHERTFQWRRYASHEVGSLSGRTVHIVSKSMFERDAVGNLCLALYGLLEQHGISARLYADEFSLAMNDVVNRRGVLRSELRPDDIILYFFSTFDRGLDDVLELKCQHRIVYYHGVTSPRLLQVFDTEMSVQCARAIRQLPSLSGFDQVVTNSEASAANLQQAFESGGAPIGTIKVIPPKILGKGELSIAGSGGNETTPLQPNLLYVGRIRSHKRIEDLLHLVAHYRMIDPRVRCEIIGSPATAAYGDYLNWVQRRQLNLPEGAVSWLGDVSESELVRAYGEATVYVSMSEDEGFCLPILEAMMHNNLVFAYDLPAIRELMSDSGVIFPDKCYPELARRIRDLLGSPAACRDMLDAQRRRALDVIQAMDGRRFMQLLSETETV